jgi:ribonuclease-3
MSIMQTKTNYMNDGFTVTKPDGEQEIVHIPYNLNNREVTEQDIIKILSDRGVKIDHINHIEYFIQAFTHKSYCVKDIYPKEILECAKMELGNPPELLDLYKDSYERLEYLGDRVLKLLVSFYLFKRYPKQDEGFMTRLQTKIEDKKNLAIMSKEIGLGKHFIISRQIEMMNGRNLEKIHEDVFEAFLGALFESNGFEPCMFLIINLLETMIDYSEKLYCDNNYKDLLLRVHHMNKWTFPQYVTIHMEGPPHKRKYIMGVEKQNVTKDCSLETRCISFGIGSSKKEGEQNAAKMSLIIHGILKSDQYVQSDIYYPPWDKIASFDGVNMIISDNMENNSVDGNEDKEQPQIVEKEKEKEREKEKETIDFIEDQAPTNKKPKSKTKKTKDYDSDCSVYSDKSM